MRFAQLIPILLLTACSAPQAVPPDSVPAPQAGDPQRLVGTVRVVGSMPVNVQVVLQPDEGKSIQLVGPLGPELEQLAGVRVAVTGPVERSPDPMADRQVRVARYEILSVDGEPVLSGVVEGTSNGWTLLRTAEGELVYLASAPAGLRPGQTIWVRGPRAAIVQSYGVVKP